VWWPGRHGVGGGEAGHKRRGRAATTVGERTTVLTGAWTTRLADDDSAQAAVECEVAP
jgi:hypothetical protein